MKIGRLKRSSLIGILLYVATIGSGLPTLTAQQLGEGNYTIVCLGDSITAGATLEDRIAQSYPGQLEAMLGDGVTVHNLGVYGRTLMELEGQSYAETGRVEHSFRLNPDVYLVMLGTNDSKWDNWKEKKRFESDYNKLVAQLRLAEPNAKIYLFLPPHAWRPKVVDDAALEEQVSIIQAVAEKQGVGVIDFYHPTAEAKALFPDGIHPNIEGSRFLAKIVYQELHELGFTKQKGQD